MRNKNVQAKVNLISEKEAQLNALVSDSENAVSSITNMISRLENVNERIVTTRQEICAARADLARLDDSMEQRHDRNAKIIDKFKSFLEE